MEIKFNMTSVNQLFTHYINTNHELILKLISQIKDNFKILTENSRALRDKILKFTNEGQFTEDGRIYIYI